MLLEVHNLSHRFGKTAVLHDVSFSLQVGEIVCILGPSGCGKSTLLRIIAGLENTQTGEIKVNDVQVASPRRSLPPEERRIGLVFQDYALFPHLTISQNVQFGMKGMSSKEKKELARKFLDEVGLLSYVDRFPNTLSGGQQQRVALVRALAASPLCLCLDEPFSGLDGVLRQEVRARTLEVLRNNNQGALIVTHDPEEAALIADRIILLNDGKLEQYGTPRELALKPKSAFVASFLSGAQVFSLRKDHHFAIWLHQQRAFKEYYTNTDAAQLAIHPEAVIIASDCGGPSFTDALQGRVEEMLWLGPLLHLKLSLPQEMSLSIQAHLFALHAPNLSVGDLIEIRLDKRGVHLFG